ncbi:phage tail tape measure protein [Nakamurella sp. PAMC28650]|uniref:phage tail tape measure protein n=1 Tax=Nakamurella sp. PAMC28650 TaxID=2762325 RepID=UPI00164D17A6|nr:phage tail tape measure protein [Nakamurella sp. PAMC28650]
MASDFNQQMELVHTQAGASQAEVEALKNQVLALAPAVGFGPTALALALFHVESVGYRGADAMAVLKIAAEGAAIGQASLDDTTYALTSTMKSFNLEGIGAATKTMGELNAIVGSGDMKMQDLNAAIQTGILSTAQTFGIDIQSMGAALSYLTDRGEKADVASTRLSMGITLMAAPTQKAAKLLGDIGMAGPAVVASTDAMTQALRKAGLTTVTLADDLRKPDGIQVALQDLQTHLTASGISADDAAALMSRAFGGGRTDKALMALIENLTGIKQKYDAIGVSANNFGEDWAAQQAQANQKLKEFQAGLQSLAIQLGEHVLVAIFATIGAVQKMWTAFTADKGVQDAFKLIAAAAGQLWQAIATQLAPALEQLWPKVQPLVMLLAKALGVDLVFSLLAVIKVTTWSVELFAEMIKLVSTLISWVESAVGASAKFASEWVRSIGGMKNAIGDFVGWLLGFGWSSIGGTIGRSIVNGVTGVLKGLSSSIPGANTALHDLHIPGFATGGVVPGSMGQPVLALVHGGETITPPGEKFGGNANSVGGSVNLTVNVGTFTGSSAEFDNLAAKIYQSLMRTARANGTQLPSIGVRPA